MASTQLSCLIKEVEEIETECQAMSPAIETFEAYFLGFKNELHERTREPFATTLASLVEFGDCVVRIAAASGDRATRRDLIAKAKARAAHISADFNRIHEHAKETMKSADDTKTNIVHLRSRAHEYPGRIHELIRAADDLKTGAEQTIAISRERLQSFNRDAEIAKDAKRRAEAEKEEKESQRTLRRVGGLLLGVVGTLILEFGDVGDLNETIETQSRVIGQSEENARRADGAAREAQADVDRINREIGGLSDLRNRFGAITGSLNALCDGLDHQLSQATDLSRTAFDLSIFLGNLVAYSSPMENMRTPEDFAGRVKKLQDEMDLNAGLSGPFVDAPHLVTEGLRAILDAQDVEPLISM